MKAGEGPPGGEGVPGERTALARQEKPERPDSITELLTRLVGQVGKHLAPDVRRTLAAGLKDLTTGRARKTAFSVFYALGIALTGVALVVADLLGLLVSPQMVGLMFLFVPYLFAVLLAGLAVRMGWLVTPEEAQIRRVNLKADARFQALKDYGERQTAAGVSSMEIEQELGPKRREIFDEQFRALAAIGRDDSSEERLTVAPPGVGSDGEGAS